MNNQTIYATKIGYETIPFIDIILPYTIDFLDKLEEKAISSELLNKLHLLLLQKLSLAAEVTLHEELDSFKKNENNIYQEFIEMTGSLLAIRYPVLNKILKTIVNNYLIHIQTIFLNFSKDYNRISEIFAIKISNEVIADIDTSLGDGHGGESTALVTLSDGTKLIYKPRNVDTTNSYNLFIDWVNHKLNTNLKTFKCVSCGSYGWLEFVPCEAVSTDEELQEYYYKAGILLAITLLLGSKDCHYENIIASGSNPVLVDHETIVQPILSKQSIRTWDEQHKIPAFSVLESMLIVNRDRGVPLEHVGYGVAGNVEAMDIEKKIVNPNSIDSKRSTHFVFRNLIKNNVPYYKDKYVFASSYKDSFINGFSETYDMFMASKEELMSYRSPIHFFKNQEIRYVWRPTFIYFRILKYMRATSFMSSLEAYKSKLYELMSKAYQKENFKNYKLILECEMRQMLNGDIPLFNLNSLDCYLEEDNSFKIFRYNCIENIKHRVELLSIHHKKEQLEYIINWLNA